MRIVLTNNKTGFRTTLDRPTTKQGREQMSKFLSEQLGLKQRRR